MTRNDIIRMAREADLLEVIDDAYQERGDWHPFVERFAALVADAEREKFCSDLRWLHDVYSLQSISPIREKGQ